MVRFFLSVISNCLNGMKLTIVDKKEIIELALGLFFLKLPFYCVIVIVLLAFYF